MSSSSFTSDFPEPVYEIIPEPEEEIYVTIAEFQATAGDGISFGAGTECTVVTKNPAGWWYVDMDGQEGWVPSSYLERKSSSPTPTTSPSAKSPTSNPPLPLLKKPAKKEPLKDPKREPKKEPVKKELVREPLRKEPVRKEPSRPVKEARKDPPPPVRRELKNETSPLGSRKFSLASRRNNFTDGEESPRPLRRSTSTDSGLYEELGVKKRDSNPLHSPPPVRAATAAPPRPQRPRITPTLPNIKPTTSVTKSPKVDRNTLKATISQPLPYQPSPGSKRRAETSTTSTGGKSSRPSFSRSGNNSDSIKVGRVPTALGASRSPTLGKPHMRRSDEGLNSSSNHVGEHKHLHSKKNSSPEMRLDSSFSKRPTGGDPPSRPAPYTRRSSTDNNTSKAYKLELTKKLGGAPPAQQQPKRPSPPNRPKAPTMRSGGGGTKTQAPPSRPVPPKAATTPSKRPPPPRPAGAPKKQTHVTIGDYTGDSSSSCLSFRDGEEVEVLEKSNDGWWFVKIGEREGWAPSTYIEEKQQSPAGGGGKLPPPRPKPPPPFSGSAPSTNKRLEPEEDSDPTPRPKPRPRPRKPTTCFYRALDSYEAEEDSALPLVQGRLYELKEKSDGDWWLMKDGDVEGWAPSSYFKLA